MTGAPEVVALPDVDSMKPAALKREIAERSGEPVTGSRRITSLRRTLRDLREQADAAEPTPAEPEPAPPGDVVDGVVVAEEDDTAMVPPQIVDEVGHALALREAAPAPQLAVPTAGEFNAMQTQAIAIANTGMVPVAYRGKPDDVLAAFLFGRELGMGLMTALRDIYMIDGRPALAAHRQLGQIRRGGVVILESEATDDRAYILARRVDTGEVMPVEFTMEEAKRIQRNGKWLVDGDNWKSYPRDMLWARCVGRLTRRLAPDLLGGLPPYTAEEVADFSGWGVEYGEQGQVQVRVGRNAHREPDPDGPEPIRQEFPAWNIPKSWPELRDRFAAHVGEAEAAEWMRQATKAATGVDSFKALTTAQKKVAFQRCCFALAQVDALGGGDLQFDPNVRGIVAEAFASRLDGVVLDGPPWRLGPAESEAERPTREEWLEQNPVPAPEPESPNAGADADGGDTTEQVDLEREAAIGESRTWGQLTPEERAEAEAISFGDDDDNPYGG